MSRYMAKKFLNQEDLHFYDKAMEEWSRIWNDPNSKTVDRLAELLTSKQSDFEKSCGGSRLGREIMGWSGLLWFYDAQYGLKGEDGFKAGKLMEAFQQSKCSHEVVETAEKAWKLLR